ncbi:MAG: aminodeoxychorismate/anthranilate synthase component II [Phycisphaerales bacterium]
MILIIDNYDSFTWNLVHRLGELDPALDIRVVRNDELTADQIAGLAPERVIVSPGPCTPTESGVSNDALALLAGRVPILGVCLGHQCMGFISGMTVERHTRIVHGKTSAIHHDARGLFAGMSNPFTATRYHSLIVREETVDTSMWEVSAWTEDTLDDGTHARVVMGLRRKWDDPSMAPMDGVQFHPESFLTTEGHRLFANFLALPDAEARARKAMTATA